MTAPTYTAGDYREATYDPDAPFGDDEMWSSPAAADPTAVLDDDVISTGITLGIVEPLVGAVARAA